MSRRQRYAQANYSKSWIVDGAAHRARGEPRGAGRLQSRGAGILQRRRAWSLEGARRSKPRGQRANRNAHAKLKGGCVEKTCLRSVKQRLSFQLTPHRGGTNVSSGSPCWEARPQKEAPKSQGPADYSPSARLSFPPSNDTALAGQRAAGSGKTS